jgi:hypothetical protein
VLSILMLPREAGAEIASEPKPEPALGPAE